MTQLPSPAPGYPADQGFLAHGGAVGALMRQRDWSASPLGPPSAWPASLRTLAGLVLDAGQPMFLAWGPELGVLYNDAYATILRAQHPEALGQAMRGIWSESWERILPLVERTLAGEACGVENLRLPHGHGDQIEHSWYDLSFTPIRDEAGQVAGIFCSCAETTRRVLADRSQAATEAALRESETRFRSMADNSPVMIWMTDADGRSTWLNRRWTEFTGQSLEEALGFGWLEATHPEDRARTEAHFIGANAAAGDFTVEYRLRHREDGWRWVLDAAAPRLGPDSTFLGYIGSVIDISERHDAEAAVRESEARFRALVEASAQVVWARDSDGRSLGDSPSWRAFTGQSPEEFAGWGWLDALHPEDRARTAARVHASLASHTPYEIEYRLRHHAGGWRWTLVRGVPLFNPDGGLRMWIGMNTDINEQRAAEAALRELNAALKVRVAEHTEERDRLWRISHDLMLVAGFDGAVRAVNPAWTTVLGWTEAELHHTDLFSLCHPDDLLATQQEAARLAAGHVTRSFENRCRHKDGSWRRISWVASSDAGLVHGIGRDVTAEHEATEALRTAEEQLRQAQKMEALGQLTGGIAHDFNNLLTGILGSLALLQRRVAAGRITEVERYVEAASQSARRAAALTQRLLAFARRQPLDPRPVDATQLLEGMVELLRRSIGAAIGLEIHAEPGGWPILCDPSQLENAILNLAINARDAMPDGGRLRISLIPASLPAEGELPAGDHLCLEVADTGVGMAPAVMARAFDPFFTTKPLGQGTGLGLSMVYGFARQSGGVARLRSTPGQGTVVTLCLPRYRGEMPAAPAVADAIEADGPTRDGGTVLVVEDEAVVLGVLIEVLRDLGYQTLHATNGRAGLEALRDAGPLELLVTDVGLPGGMNGRQLAEQARQLRPELRVLFVTGYADAAALGAEALEPGMALLTKPFSMEALARHIRGMTALPR